MTIEVGNCRIVVEPGRVYLYPMDSGVIVMTSKVMRAIQMALDEASRLEKYSG